jgi:hypothetical protein
MFSKNFLTLAEPNKPIQTSFQFLARRSILFVMPESTLTHLDCPECGRKFKAERVILSTLQESGNTGMFTSSGH